ncbi:hypothetical protein SAMN04487934_101115 [Eubacterium ruminantium]|nr:hypothetical protein SAMN04487934_101115 [Eubacterium ruminantium]
MNRLIKCEMNRNKKLSGFWYFTVGIGLFILLTAFLSEERSSGAFVASIYNTAYVIIAMMFASYLTGHGYSQRTNMYEIMIGNRPMKIIISKCISVGVTVALILSVLAAAGFGISSLFSTKAFDFGISRLLLFMVIMLRSSLCGVLITMCFRSMASMAIVYFRLMAEIFVIMIYGAINGNMSEILNAGLGVPKILYYLFYTNQFEFILAKNLSAQMIIYVFGGLIISVLLWGSVVYYLYKKKDFK